MPVKDRTKQQGGEMGEMMAQDMHKGKEKIDSAPWTEADGGNWPARAFLSHPCPRHTRTPLAPAACAAPPIETG